MKKITLLFLLLSGIAFGQNQNLTGDAYYRLIANLSLGQGGQGSACGYGGLQTLYAFKSNGEVVWLKPNDGSWWEGRYVGTFPFYTFQFFNISITGVNNNPDVLIKFKESNLITGFHIYSARRESNYGSCSTTSQVETNRSIARDEDRSYYNFNNGGVLAETFDGTVNMVTFPDVVLNLSNVADNIVGSDDYINMSPIDGILDQYYTWQFWNPFLPVPAWVNFPIQHQQHKYFNVIGNELLPPSAHGMNLKIRAKLGRLNTLSNELILNYRLSAPHIVGNPDTIRPNCYGENNGSAKFTFDRFIDPGVVRNSNLPNPEQFNYSLKKLDPIANTYTLTAGSGSVTMNSLKEFTITGLNAGKYEIKFIGFLNNDNTYTNGLNHSRQFEIFEPDHVAFNTSKVNVWCNGGSDGQITINATGDVDPLRPSNYGFEYNVNGSSIWLPFSTANTHIMTGLLPGNYTIKVRDTKGCIAKVEEFTNGVFSGVDINSNKSITLNITQPAPPLNITYTQMLQPLFFGGTNGRLVAQVKGGTLFANNTYDYVWTNSAGIPQICTTSFTAPDTFNITLDGIGSDTYTLTVKDKNFNSATQQSGCTDTPHSIQFLGQPAKLIALLNITHEISCNKTNAYGNETNVIPSREVPFVNYRDESEDGEIISIVTGGVPFAVNHPGTYGLPYIYTWKKQSSTGTWQTLTNEHQPVLLNVSDGNYALNIEDANGIKLGTYVNNQLSLAIDVEKFMPQPPRFELNFSKQDVTCGTSNDGWAKAIPTGGTPPYSYAWTNNAGSTTDLISGLSSGPYFVRVFDSKGCMVEGTVVLPQPNGTIITSVDTNPVCNLATNGSIDLNIAGGILPSTYSYLWSNGATTQDLVGVPAGTYSVVITNTRLLQNSPISCTFSYQTTLINPPAIVVDLGDDRTLCNNQIHHLDLSIANPGAQYLWTSTNGFTSTNAVVDLTLAATYHAKVISPLGCIGEDDITIATNQVVISSEFFLASQAYLDENVVLINASNPLGQNTSWIIPSGVTIVNQQNRFIELHFNSIGAHTISLRQTQGDCYALYSKIINVESRSSIPNANSTNNPFIKNFIISQNPNPGIFTAIINLQEISPVKLRMYNSSGQLIGIERSEVGQKNYALDYSLSIASGTYVLVLETAQQTLVKRIMIQ